MSSWYVAFAVGAGCIFVVVIALVVVMQLTRQIGVQLAEVRNTLTVIRTDTAALQALGGINSQTGEMNEILADARKHLHRVVRGART